MIAVIPHYAFTASIIKSKIKRTSSKINSLKAHTNKSSIEDDTIYDGWFIGASVGGSPSDYQLYSSKSPASTVPYLLPTNRLAGGDTIWYVNGVRNTVEEQFITMQSIADRSGHPVIGIHNATAWFLGIKDFGQSLKDIFNVGNNKATETLVSALTKELDNNNQVHLLGHSQGTIIINNAIKKIKSNYEAKGLNFCQVLKKLSLIKAEIFGSPVRSFVNGPSYIHICNYEDFICNDGGIGKSGWRRTTDILIEAEINSSKIKKSKLQTEVYGANSYVFNFNRNYSGYTPGDDHSIDKVYIKNRGAAIFPLAPSCSPSLFLFDTSGSMAENGKWDGVLKTALDTLKNFEQLSEVKSQFFPTSVLSFAGGCSESSVGKLFDFPTDTNMTSDADMISNVKMISNKLPSTLSRPNGGTPLEISKGVAQKLMDEYLKKIQGNQQKTQIIEECSLYVLSDGEDTCGQIRPNGYYSSGSLKSLNTSLPKCKLNVIGDNLEPGSKGERDLQYMAFVGGGKYYNAADTKQLQRAFQKLTQSYSPKNLALTDSQLPKFRDTLEKAGIALQKKKAEEAIKLYRQLEADFKRDAINSPELYFNLAQSLEANDRYKGAVEYYQLYLKSNPQAADKALVEQKIVTLKQDYKDQFEYYFKVIESDLTYLRKYYEDLFNKNNNELAAEFAGFVTEKGEFYTNLHDILEIQDKEIKNHSKDLSDGLYDLSDRIDSPSFDRDAVSLLTLPISELEEILELLNKNKSKLINI